MGLLTPLYALAALAIVGPILFHMIRRQPQGQMQFSSLMFLTPSPPRLTRRSRLDNLFLLLLRALAIGLIAIAFARPYLRQDSFLNSTLTGRRLVVLVDTSGSMQRADVWSGAKAELVKLLDELSPNDQVALYTIDSELRSILPIDSQGLADAAASQQAVRAAINNLQPTWQRTQLADGLKSIADLIMSVAIAGKADPTAENEVVLITDLHNESQLDSLQGFAWPETISLDVRRILPAIPGNARPSLMNNDEADAAASGSSEPTLRVRIENEVASQEQAFRVSWADANGPLLEGQTTVQVPPGQVRVVPMSNQPTGATRIVLDGDAWDADNSAFVVEPIATLERIVFCGSEQAKAEDDLSYFLQRAPLSTELYRREVVKSTVGELEVLLAEPETKAVVLEPVAELDQHAALLTQFVQRGGIVLVSFSRGLSDNSDASSLLNALMETSGIEVSEAPVRDFSLLSKIDFTHPVFSPFADPRFNDFGKIRFWSHRHVVLPEQSDLQIVASYDDQTPMLLEKKKGSGRFWIITSGWQPAASGLGLSSKFVPLMMGLLDPLGRSREKQFTYEVGDKIDVEQFVDLHVNDSQGQPLEETHMIRQGKLLSILTPGMYWLIGDQMKRQVAIQLPASESRVTPLDSDLFEQYGIKLGKVESDASRRETVRQLQVEELEGKQRLWQWLLAACLGVLGCETLLAGWLAKR